MTNVTPHPLTDVHAGRGAVSPDAELRPDDDDSATYYSHPATAFADLVHDTRASLGVLRVEELPIPGYDTLNVGMASTAIEELGTIHDVEVVLA